MTPSLSATERAKQQYAAGDIAAALSTLATHIAQQTPPPRDSLRVRSHMWIACNEIGKAAEDLDLILKHYPQDAESLDDRGVLYQMYGDHMNAAVTHLRAVEINPSHDGYLLNLAIALDHLGQKHNAEQLYRDILLINPDNTRAMINLGIILDDKGLSEEALPYLQKALEGGNTRFELYMALGNLHRKNDETDLAATYYRTALTINPNNAQAQFMLDAIQGNHPAAPPEEHISDLFDSYAETFEKSLVDKLKYRAPEMLFAHIKNDLERINSSTTNVRALDLGAGTGLFGKLIRPYIHTSIGLDLSEKMLRKAQESAIYDEIICVEMLRGLQEFPDNHFHVISAADVFVYQGDLDAIFAEVFRTLVAGGLFTFSTESLHTTDTSNDFALNNTGRYTHSEAYIRRLADAHHFTIQTFEHNWLRYNKDKPLDGFIVVLTKSV